MIVQESFADDWFFWQNLIDAASHLGDGYVALIPSTAQVLLTVLPPGRPTETVHSLTKEFFSVDPTNRNAGRAYLTCISKSPESLLQSCLQFFNSNSSRPSCFEDLKDFLPQLSHDEQSQFLAHIDEAAKAIDPWSETP